MEHHFHIISKERAMETGELVCEICHLSIAEIIEDSQRQRYVDEEGDIF